MSAFKYSDLLYAKDFYAKYEPTEKLLGTGLSCVVKLCLGRVTYNSQPKSYAVKIIDTRQSHKSDTTQNFDDDFNNYNSPSVSTMLTNLVESTKMEVELLRKCQKHCNVIKLFDFFEYPTHMFLVFELCPNGELFDYLNDSITIPTRQARHFLWQIISAVGFLHDNDIVHRDIKPENILLDANYNVKLSDFGFAVVLKNGDTKLRELCGTPSYLAPETLRASMYEDAPGYDHAVDMWACGVVLYTILCGFPPFWHRHQVRMLRLIMTCNYSFNYPEFNDISNEAKDLISRLLVLDASARLTARSALDHEFLRYAADDSFPFGRQCAENLPADDTIAKSFKSLPAQRRFRKVVRVVMAVHRLQKLPAPQGRPRSSSYDISEDYGHTIYRNRAVRRWIDAAAFSTYGHWVRRHDELARATMFQMNTK